MKGKISSHSGVHVEANQLLSPSTLVIVAVLINTQNKKGKTAQTKSCFLIRHTRTPARNDVADEKADSRHGITRCSPPRKFNILHM